MVNQVAFTKHLFSDWDGALTELWPHELNQVAAITRSVIRGSRTLAARPGWSHLYYCGEDEVVVACSMMASSEWEDLNEC